MKKAMTIISVLCFCLVSLIGCASRGSVDTLIKQQLSNQKNFKLLADAHNTQVGITKDLDDRMKKIESENSVVKNKTINLEASGEPENLQDDAISDSHEPKSKLKKVSDVLGVPVDTEKK
jgi:hypothetical protein